MAALVDYFLNINDIQGESRDATYKNWIQLQAWQWSEENSGHWGFGSGGGAGKVQMKDFEFQMVTNKASPKLFLLCATGEHISKAQLVCRKSGKGQQDFLKIVFSNCLVSSFKTLGNLTIENRRQEDLSENAVLPIDVIKLNFARIEIEYKEQNNDGSMGAAMRAGYDLKSNTRI